MGVPPLPCFQNLRIFTKQFQTQKPHIIKIHFMEFHQIFVIITINIPYFALGKQVLRKSVKPFSVIFYPADIMNQAVQFFIFRKQRRHGQLQNLRQKISFLCFCNQGKLTILSGLFQDRIKDSVKSAENDKRTDARAFYQFMEPLLHFSRRRSCKGDNQNTGRVHAAIRNQITNALCNRKGFATSGPCKHLHRTGSGRNGFLLFGTYFNFRHSVIFQFLF